MNLKKLCLQLPALHNFWPINLQVSHSNKAYQQLCTASVNSGLTHDFQCKPCMRRQHWAADPGAPSAKSQLSMRSPLLSTSKQRSSAKSQMPELMVISPLKSYALYELSMLRAAEPDFTPLLPALCEIQKGSASLLQLVTSAETCQPSLTGRLAWCCSDQACGQSPHSAPHQISPNSVECNSHHTPPTKQNELLIKHLSHC